MFVDYRVQDSQTLLEGITSDTSASHDGQSTDTTTTDTSATHDSSSTSTDSTDSSDTSLTDSSSTSDSALDTSIQSSADDAASGDTGSDTSVSSDSSNVVIVYINEGEDGVDVITNTLQNYHDVSSVQILAHGGGGNVLLGSTNLNSTTVHQRQDEIAQWGDSMTDNGDILLYGCLTANGKAGVDFVNSLAATTHADVAASTGKVGDGSWDLNYHTGSIEAGVIVSQQAQAEYTDLLANIVVAPPTTAVADANIAGITSLADFGNPVLQPRWAHLAARSGNLCQPVRLARTPYSWDDDSRAPRIARPVVH